MNSSAWKRSTSGAKGALGEPWAFPYETQPAYGLSPAQLAENRDQLAEASEISAMLSRWATSQQSKMTSAKRWTPSKSAWTGQSVAYPKLGIEVLKSVRRALQAIEQRNAGEPVPTPPLIRLRTRRLRELKEAFEGWKKERERPDGTVHEYGGPSKCSYSCTAICPSWKSNARTRARFAKHCN